jgi:hypothetical protein
MKDINDELRLYADDSQSLFNRLEKVIYAITDENDTSEDTIDSLRFTLEEFGSVYEDLLTLLNEKLDEEI